MLIVNGVRYGGGPMRFEGGQNAASIDRGHSPGQKAAGYLNFNHGEATVGSAAPAFGIPHGARHPATWMMGEVGGGIKSYKRGGLTVEASATGEKGLPATASSTITITGTAAAGLIVSATGTGTIAINGEAAIVATIGTTGQVTITINGAIALGAEASLTGTGTITIDGHADAMALGYMTGTTEEAGLTPSGIALAVWNYLINGTEAQSLLATAGSGGVDYDTLWASMPAALKESLAAYVLAAAEVTPINATSQDNILEGSLTEGEAQRIMLSAMAGRVEKSGSTIVFKSVDGLTDRITGTVDDQGNRTAVVLDGS